ncbi:MAG: hypothetical protein IIB38_17480 [Candidatus Hydrogenedentes bacterium]|nr:hypothetical protein [Candidatus Hydrogenedentota bacterium]
MAVGFPACLLGAPEAVLGAEKGGYRYAGHALERIYNEFAVAVVAGVVGYDAQALASKDFTVCANAIQSGFDRAMAEWKEREKAEDYDCRFSLSCKHS